MLVVVVVLLGVYGAVGVGVVVLSHYPIAIVYGPWSHKTGSNNSGEEEYNTSKSGAGGTHLNKKERTSRTAKGTAV